MLNHYKLSLPVFEAGIQRMLEDQCMNRELDFYGVMEDVMLGYTEPSNGCGIASAYLTAYYTPGIKYYRDKELLFRAKTAMEYTLRLQHEDGTLDLMTTNFHDSTMCGFTMQGVGPAYLLMRKFTQHTPEEDEVDAVFMKFIKNCGEAMVNCGFHTPNHRWVVSSSLAYCYNIVGDERYLAHLNKFLAEGIDCDENGEFTERSTGSYNIVCDRSLIIMAQQLNMPELLDHVSRNLYMVMKYFEPDETMNTMNSTRQDFGTDPEFYAYYDSLLYMALLKNDPQFAWLADYMLKKTLGRFADNPSKGGGISPQAFLMDPGLEQKMLDLETQKPSFEYDVHFVESGIVRKRVGDATLTLIKDRPHFAKLQYKNKRVMIRFAGSFFGPHAQFVGQTLEKTADGYRLTYHKSWGYKRPLEVPQGTSDWRKMDHSKRENVCMQDFDVRFDFLMRDDELEFTVDAGGCERIPLKLELMFDAGGAYSTPDTELVTRAGDYVFLKRGSASYTFEDKNRFIIEGGFNKHRCGKNMRGSIPGDAKAFTVVMTGFTPEKKTVKLRWGGMNTY